MWVIHQETRIAVVYGDRLEVMGFVVSEDDPVEYDLSPATVSAIASAIDKIDVSACEMEST